MQRRCQRHRFRGQETLLLLAALLAGAHAQLGPTGAATADPPAASANVPVLPAASAPPASLPAGAPTPNATDKYSMIVVFKEFKTLITLKAMCANSSLVYRTAAHSLGLPPDCHLPGVCRRVYSTAVFGFAGDFTDAEVRTLHRCLPGAVWYRELDATVHKAEDVSMQRRAGRHVAGEAGRRLLDAGAPVQGAVADTPGLVDVPPVQSLEVVNKTKGGDGAPINMDMVTGGVALGAAGEHRESVPNLLWNLDRIDQHDLPLDGKYIYGSSSSSGTGAGVTVYSVDSGIKLDHQEFKDGSGGDSRASYGYDFVNDDGNADDCDGHGTHTAATAVGLSVGVAKASKVVAVRMLDCSGSGTISNTVAALDWVAANAKKPAVATLSLGIQVGSWSRVLEDAVRSLVNTYGVTVVVASGNSAVDACYVAPANVPEVITVAATDLPDKYNTTSAGDKDTPYRWGNTGPCVDMFAPGVDIYSACGSGTRCEIVDDHSYTYASGTSMATPAVAGAAALYLQDHPQASPSEVKDALNKVTTQGAIDPTGFMQGTANRLLYSRVSSGGGGSAPQGAHSVAASNGPSSRGPSYEG